MGVDATTGVVRVEPMAQIRRDYSKLCVVRWMRVCLNMPRFAAVCFALPREVIWRAVSGSYILIFEFKKSKV